MKKSTLLIWVLILADLLTGLLLALQLPFSRLGLLIKGIVILLLFIAYLTRLRQKAFSSIYLSMAILFIVWFFGFFLSWFNEPNFDPAESLIVLNRYFLFLILSCAFLDWSEGKYFEIECGRILDFFFIINNAFIFIGFFFKIDLLSTYDPYSEYGEGWRFGYKGLIFGQNAVAAIYTIGIAYLFREAFKYGNSKVFLLITTCLATILIGTKATWITLVLIGGYYLYVYRIKTLILFIIPILAGLAYSFVLYWQVIREKYMTFIVDKYETMDFFTFWTSNRNGLLSNVINHIDEDWTFVNFIIGDAISYVEMDFFDLYFYFGIAGLIYLFIYIKLCFIKDKTQDNWYFFGVWMTMAFVAGHIINSAIVPLFYLLFIFSARDKVHERLSFK